MADLTRSVRPPSHHCLMFLAELICSDDDCELTREAVGDLTELELLVCEDCGSWSGWRSRAPPDLSA